MEWNAAPVLDVTQMLIKTGYAPNVKKKRKMLKAYLKQCNNCQSLKDLLEDIDCSLYNLIRNKYNNEKFNVEEYFSLEHFKDLSRYKRILTYRIYNPNYTRVNSQDLIAQVQKLIYGDTNCSRCFDCDTTTTTSL